MIITSRLLIGSRCGLSLLVIGLALAAVGGYEQSSLGKEKNPRVTKAEAIVIAAEADRPAVTRLPAHQITLGPTGFEPAEAIWQKGPFFLVVHNRSGIAEVTLRFDREVGGRLKEVNLNPQKHRWAGVLDPPPGRYLLSEASHPEWTCHVVITGR